MLRIDSNAFKHVVSLVASAKCHALLREGSFCVDLDLLDLDWQRPWYIYGANLDQALSKNGVRLVSAQLVRCEADINDSCKSINSIGPDFDLGQGTNL